MEVIFDSTHFVSPLAHKCTFVVQLFCLLCSNVYGLLRDTYIMQAGSTEGNNYLCYIAFLWGELVNAKHEITD